MYADECAELGYGGCDDETWPGWENGDAEWAWSLYAAADRPVPSSSASGGGGVFSRGFIGSGAGGAAGL